MVTGGTLLAQDDKLQEVIIQTSAECRACKDRIEEAMNYTKGVKYAELDLESMKLTVKFNARKTNLDALRTKISETGYDADDVKATKEGLDALPACCKPGGMKGKK